MLTALIIAIVIGAIAGWLAGQLVQGTGFGLVGDIVVGILGALIAGFLFPMLGIALTLGGGMLGAIILAFIGAVILARHRQAVQADRRLRIHSALVIPARAVIQLATGVTQLTGMRPGESARPAHAVLSIVAKQ
jgi:uncharacterized membrane protein YeaQ/YmgE (transglycosylase-associated protein family)